MGIFGWSYPPGCNSVPGDEASFCEVCGKAEDACICPACIVCQCVGDPHCYNAHGMEQTQAQIASLKAAEEEWAGRAADDYKAAIEMQPPQEEV